MKNILVALDYLKDSPEIFEQALLLSKNLQANLHILHCIEPPADSTEDWHSQIVYGHKPNDSVSKLDEGWIEKEFSGILEWLTDLAKKAEENEVLVNAKYRVGDPKTAICKEAEEINADLIIMGRRGLSGIREFLMGSVSYHVVRNIKCSVMVVQ